MGSEKWKMKRDTMRGRCRSHVTSVTRSSVCPEVSLELTRIKCYRREQHETYRGTGLKFVTFVIKLLCEITEEWTNLLQKDDRKQIIIQVTNSSARSGIFNFLLQILVSLKIPFVKKNRALFSVVIDLKKSEVQL